MEDVISRTNIVALKSLKTLRTLDIGENVGNLSFRNELCTSTSLEALSWLQMHSARRHPFVLHTWSCLIVRRAFPPHRLTHIRAI